MSTWTLYLMDQRQHGGYLGIAAKLVMDTIQGATPETMKRHAAKRPDARVWIERIDDLSVAWGECVTVRTALSDWEELPHGCHKRRNHVHGAS